MSNLLFKKDFTTQELQMLQLEMNKRQRSSGTTWLLWFFLGVFGAHRFYLGRTGSAVAMLLTFGGLGIWAFIDLFLVSGMVRNANEEIETKIVEELMIMKKAQLNDVAVSAQ